MIKIMNKGKRDLSESEHNLIVHKLFLWFHFSVILLHRWARYWHGDSKFNIAHVSPTLRCRHWRRIRPCVLYRRYAKHVV